MPYINMPIFTTNKVIGKTNLSRCKQHTRIGNVLLSWPERWVFKRRVWALGFPILRKAPTF